MKIYQSEKYLCKKHGEVVDTISSRVKGIEGVWCQHCLVEWIDKNFDKLEEVKEKNNERN